MYIRYCIIGSSRISYMAKWVGKWIAQWNNNKRTIFNRKYSREFASYINVYHII